MENNLSTILPKTANQLLGLRFGNKIDELLGSGLTQKSLTYIYGKMANYMLNTLCVNALHTYGGHSIFLDSGNSFDPYGILRESNLKKNDSETAENVLKSIYLSRAFTCHQLVNLVTVKLEQLIASDSKINAVFVSGIDSVFSREDNTVEEINRLQLLIASALRDIGTDKKNGIIYMLASSNNLCADLLHRSNTAIKLYQDGDKEKALLARNHARQYAAIEL